MEKRGGFSYHCSDEQIQAFKKLSINQRLKWVEEMNRFLHAFRPKKSAELCEKIRSGK